jgi:hypothetical protein
MANQNVLQLQQQSGTANTTSVLYAAINGTTDTGLPLTVLFNSPTFTGTPIVPGYISIGSVVSLPTGSTAVTQGYLDNSTDVATDQFVKRSILASTAVIPFSITGGTYNFATAGANGSLVILASGGIVQSIPAVANAGTGYQVGDCLILNGGNGDGIAIVTGVSGGGITSAGVLYGGTGYTTGATLVVSALPPGSRDGVISGTLTSNATIIIPAGVYLQGARRIVFSNNTTGGFTVTVKLSNGLGGSTGTGVVLPQGTNNSSSMVLLTDGVNDVWSATGAYAQLTGGTFTGPVTFTSVTASSVSATTLGASGTTTLATTNINGVTTMSAASTVAYTNPLFSVSDTSGTGHAYIAWRNNGTNVWDWDNNSSTGVFVLNRYVSGTQVDSPISVSNSTGVVTFADGIAGVTSGTAAAAGIVGEYPTATTSGTSLTTGTIAVATSKSLTAGQYLIWGSVVFAPGTSPSYTNVQAGISSSSTAYTIANAIGSQNFPANTSQSGINLVVPPTIIDIAATTTYYLLANATFSASTMSVTGNLQALRVR